MAEDIPLYRALGGITHGHPKGAAGNVAIVESDAKKVIAGPSWSYHHCLGVLVGKSVDIAVKELGYVAVRASDPELPFARICSVYSELVRCIELKVLGKYSLQLAPRRVSYLDHEG